MSEPILQVTGLRKTYDGVEAVRKCAFQIRRGECFGLLGPNGAGKTTAIGLLSGLIKPTEGRISIDGIDLFSRPNEAKAKLGLVPQSFALYPTLSAWDNLLFFGRLYGLKGSYLRDRMEFVLKSVDLKERTRQPVATFSSGMKRRLNIAIGLLHEPEMLILDEPTVGVDTQNRIAILEDLRALNQSGVTILYTTHYIEEAQRLCSRVAIMDEGRLLAIDTPSALIQRFAKEILVLEFDGIIEDQLLNPLESLGAIRVFDGSHKRIHIETQCTEKAVAELVRLRETGMVPFVTLNRLEPNLETAFIHLTGREIRNGKDQKADEGS